MSRQILILAGGKGTRMGTSGPKVLIPIHGKPVINYLLEQAAQVPDSGVPVIVVGYEHEQVEQALGSEYVYVMQEEQLGTGHAVQVAQDVITADHLLVLPGDTPFIKSSSMLELIKLHEQTGGPITMFTTTVPNYEGVYEHFLHYGRIIREGPHKMIAKITEYKDATEEEKQICEVNLSIYIFNTIWLWPSLKRINNHNAQEEYYLTDLVELAIKDGFTVQSLPIEPGEVFGINTPEHLDHAHRIVGEKR